MAAIVASNITTTSSVTQVPVPGAPKEIISLLSSSSAVVSIKPEVSAPFTAIRRLFDHLHAHPGDAAELNATYPRRGIFKTAATHNASSDQKFTIDLSPARTSLIPAALRDVYMDAVLSNMSAIAGAVLSPAHKNLNLNFRLCDYNLDTAAPTSDNGCGAHTDYGTFSIIFQDGTLGLEFEDADKPGVWTPVPGDATVILTGWYATILSGGRIRETKHRVRRTPGLPILLKPLAGIEPARPFSETVMRGDVDVEWFKAIMGRQWRWREGNQDEEIVDHNVSQDDLIGSLVWRSA